MHTSKIPVFILLIPLLICLSACERTNTVCPPEPETAQPTLALSDLINRIAQPSSDASPVQVEIGGKLMQVDKVVDYPLCNDEWSGSVYVSCDVQVAQAELDADANPLFLKGCNLNIAPNTIVYVAAHNDAPYYKGCSCHTGQAPIP